jgi:hypothetical protein
MNIAQRNGGVACAERRALFAGSATAIGYAVDVHGVERQHPAGPRDSSHEAADPILKTAPKLIRIYGCPELRRCGERACCGGPRTSRRIRSQRVLDKR